MSDTYEYKVRDKSGNVVTGSLVADNERLVLTRLRELGYTPLEVGKKRKSMNLEFNMHPGRVKLKEIAIFSRQFATMVNSGLPILRALTISRIRAPTRSSRRSVAGPYGRGGGVLAVRSHGEIPVGVQRSLRGHGEVG